MVCVGVKSLFRRGQLKTVVKHPGGPRGQITARAQNRITQKLKWKSQQRNVHKSLEKL